MTTAADYSSQQQEQRKHRGAGGGQGPLSAYRQAVLADSPRGYWRLGEAVGTVANDSSGNAQQGTYTGGFTLGAAGAKSPDTAVTLNGTTGYINIPDSALVDLGDVFTLEAWVNTITTSGQQIICDKGAAFSFRLDGPPPTLKLIVSGVTIATGSIPYPTDGNWHHLVVTKSGATTKFYQDGVDVTVLGTNTTSIDNANVLALGMTPPSVRPLIGGLDEVAVYATALSAARVLTHYQQAG